MTYIVANRPRIAPTPASFSRGLGAVLCLAAIALGAAPPVAAQSADSPTDRGLPVAEILDRASRSVVRVDLEIGDSRTISVSGFVAGDREHVLTVGVADITDAGVQFDDGEIREAEVVAVDRTMKVTLLRLDREAPGAPIAFADASQMAADGFGVVVQSPHRTGVSIGRIDGVELPEDGAIYLASDVSVPNTSLGGPLLDAAGDAIGVLVPAGPEGNLRAVPTELLDDVVERLERSESARLGTLGIGVEALDADLARSLDVSADAGVVITTVRGDGPAADRLRAGDLVTAIDGESISRPMQVPLRIARRAPGTEVAIEYRRDGEKGSARITLEARGGERQSASADGEERRQTDGGKRRARLGVAVKPVTETLASDHDLARRHGVFVTRIKEGAPADGNLRAGDVILSIDGTDVSSVDEVKRALADRPPGDTMRLRVSRDRHEILVTVDLDD